MINKIQKWKPIGGSYGKIHYYLKDENKTLCGIKTPKENLPKNGWLSMLINGPIDCKNCLKKIIS
jgi:hypothetical protein